LPPVGVIKELWKLRRLSLVSVPGIIGLQDGVFASKEICVRSKMKWRTFGAPLQMIDSFSN
jgi:hypothetical protein